MSGEEGEEERGEGEGWREEEEWEMGIPRVVLVEDCGLLVTSE